MSIILASFSALSGCGGITQDEIPTAFSPVSGAIGTVITATGYDFTTAQSFTVGGTPGIVVKATSNEFIGLVMPGSPSGALSITTSAGLISYPTSFTVSATGAPTTQLAKMSMKNAVGASNAGVSVAISANKNTILVGGPTDYFNVGAAWVFTGLGALWAQESKLSPSDSYAASDHGRSSALSADGNTALVGGPNDGDVGGAAWVYTRSNGTWSQQSKLIGTGNVGAAQQGYSVALSADGNTALIGGYTDNSNQGAAWVFTRSGGIWTQQGSKLVGTGNTGAAAQGRAIALSADGNTALIGGNTDNTNQGAAWVFTRSAGSWTQQGSKLVGTGNTGAAQQGISVSLSADGNTAIVGGSADNTNQGAAWVYTRSAGTWTQQGSKLVGTGNTGAAQQGFSTSLSADGNTAIVGGSVNAASVGAVWVYTRSSSTWSQYGSRLVGTGNIGTSRQGYSVSLTPDGSTAVFGAYLDASGSGAIWIFGQ